METMDPHTLAEVAESLRVANPSTEEMWLQIGEVALQVHSNSLALLASLGSYFGGLVRPEGPKAGADIELWALECDRPDFPYGFKDWPRDGGKVGKKEAYADFEDGRIVRKVRTGMHFLVGHGDLVAVGPCLANDNQIINFINSQYVSRRLHEGWQLCHAAGVSLGGRGLTISAKAGSGKSTLALHLMSSGWSFVSNDRVLIQNGPQGARMAGIPKMPRVNPGTLLNNPDLANILPKEREKALRTVDLKELWNLEEKYDVMIDQAYGPGRTESLAPLDALLVLNWSAFSPDKTRFEKVDLKQRPELLDLVVKSPGVFHRDPEGRAAIADLNIGKEPYFQHLQGVPVIEATGYADFELGVQFCKKLLTES